MRVLSLAMAAMVACAGLAVAEPLVPERRSVVSQDADFPGNDLRQVFDTTYGNCERICLTDTACAAFTFNSRSNACFPKSAATGQVPFFGAISARMVDVAPGLETLAGQRAGALDGLPEARRQADLEAARALAGEIGRRHPADVWQAADLRAARDAALGRGSAADAFRLAGAAAGLTDTAEDWRVYAAAALAMTERNENVQSFRETALGAALNGYLRAPADAEAARSLLVYARALEQLGRGRDMIPALRVAQRLWPQDVTDRLLEDAVGKYGFRVLETQVQNDQAAPQICAVFSEPLVPAGTDYDPFVQRDVSGLSVTAQENQLCLDGVEHGTRYRMVLRAGLPAASGEVLAKPVELSLYVRDRTPSVRFPGRAYVLPKGGPLALPVVSVNTDEVTLALRRVSDRNLLRAIQDEYFGRPLAAWQDEQFAADIGQEVWTGTGTVENALNRDVTTRLPLAEVMGELPVGIYALQARVPGQSIYDAPAATQWFVVSDLGLATLQGTDGLHVVARSLETAGPKAGAVVTLLSRANAVLGTAETDAQGVAVFEPGLTRGTGGAAPALVTVEDGGDDIAFLSLTDPEFDLSDRGVEGRPPAPPVDVFLATDRGAYRAGEVIHLTALTRDGEAEALEGLPLTAVLTRPDGVEYARQLSQDAVAGGHVFEMPVDGAAPRGTWRIETFLDTDAPALAATTVLVEDFLPERIDVTLDAPDALPAVAPPPLGVDVRYLFGAPGGDLPVEGDVRLSATRTLDAWTGYVFGAHDAQLPQGFEVLPGGQRTDAEGRLALSYALPEVAAEGYPLEATFTVRVSEGSGRPVERRVTVPVASDAPLMGLRPDFDGVLPEGGGAAFRVISLGADGAPETAEVEWTLSKVETRYQWYSLYGNWNWEPVTTRTRVANGTVTVDGPTRIAAPVEWGRYELSVARTDGSLAVASEGFSAGWYAPVDATATPDMLEVSLDRPSYAPGDTAVLRLLPRAPGTALVTVMSNRVIAMEMVEVGSEAATVELPVTEDWGAGAYVSATLIRPVADAADRVPVRALGLAYAQVDPGEHALDVAFEGPTEADPRGPLEVALRVEGVAPGEAAYATIAAVDVGILNLTGFESPDPEGWYFGQRRLGVALRDLYGRLIDSRNGAMGQVRSGGDADAGMRREAEPPTEDLVSFFSGPVEVAADGLARVSFDLPAFNGTVRLMAVVWSQTGVGAAEQDVLVRDPVVVNASLPRFLAPGDTARMLLELTHVSGPAGEMALEVSAPGLTLTDMPETVTLAEKGAQRIAVPVSAFTPGRYEVAVTLVTPDGERLARTLRLPVEVNDPEVARSSRVTLAAGQTLTFDRDIFEGFQPGTGSATLSAGPLARLDAPGLLAALDRYPYGCTEQMASRAMPLLYFDQMARALEIEGDAGIPARIADAVAGVLANQSSAGSFGLWRPEGGDFWLDAYATDFLSRARAQGYAVPDMAFRAALDNLRNRVNYAPDFDEGGEDVAYALYVLAREGAAAMGDLRYYADVKADALGTALAQAQLGAALASYGDQMRADRMFARAEARLDARAEDRAQRWRDDYGTDLRDTAGVLALVAEAGSDVVDRGALAGRLAVSAASRPRSTQEAAWSLLAAHALIADTNADGLALNGTPVEGPLVKLIEARDFPGPLTLSNSGADTEVVLTAFGVPEIPPEAGGNGYRIERAYYTPEGEPAALTGLQSGDRLVTVLTVTPLDAGEARLMVTDPLPAGFEIDNPNLLRGGDVRALDWLELDVGAEHTEARDDRFLAAVDRRDGATFRLAYIVRAVTPGSFHHPAASVEDMYRPQFRAQTGAGRVEIGG